MSDVDLPKVISFIFLSRLLASGFYIICFYNSSDQKTLLLFGIFPQNLSESESFDDEHLIIDSIMTSSKVISLFSMFFLSQI